MIELSQIIANAPGCDNIGNPLDGLTGVGDGGATDLLAELAGSFSL